VIEMRIVELRRSLAVDAPESSYPIPISEEEDVPPSTPPSSLTLFSSPIRAEAPGTAPSIVGSIWIDEGTYRFRAQVGCLDPDDAATLHVRTIADVSELVASVGGYAGGVTGRSSDEVRISTSGWYNLVLFSDDDDGLALLRGVSWR
jgi:hypothetical protein